MKINPGNARGLLVPQGDRPFSFVVYSSEIRDFGLHTLETNLADLRDQFFSDNVDVSEEDKAIEKKPDEPIQWWELFARLEEGMSRWLKAFIEAWFG